MYVKAFALFGLIAVASAADLTLGGELGRVIYEQNVTASPAIWRQVRNVTVNATKSDEVISRVVVIDNRPEKDGEAKVIEGGEGQKKVVIELQSPAVFRGFDFSIQVFGAPENEVPRVPNQPEVNAHNTKDEKDSSKQGPQNGDDIVLGAPKPTASSTTETTQAKKNTQEKINNPAVVGKEQTRLNRDTEGQKEQPSIPTSVDEVDATKDIKVNDNANKTNEADMDEGLKKALDEIFENDSAKKSEDSPKSEGVMPNPGGEELIDEDRKVRQADIDSAVPTKEVKKENPTTPKSGVSSTTARDIGQEKLVPRLIPITREGTSSESPKLPANVKTTEDLQQNLNGHHHSGHHHAVPLPYMN